MSRCTSGLLLLLLAAPAGAHDNARSTFEARPAVSAAGAGLQIVFALDASSLTDLTGAPTGPAALAYLDNHFTVSSAGARCPREAPRSFDVVATSVILDVVYRCGGLVTIESTLFHDEMIPHEVIGTIHRAGRADRIFFTRGERTQTFEVVAPRVGGFRTATPPPGAFRDSAAVPATPALPSDREDRTRPVLLAILACVAVVVIARRVTTT